jgi:hypothetical protein
METARSPLLFDLPPHFGSSHYTLPIVNSDLNAPTPWIVSADFTDWLSRMPDQIFGQSSPHNMMEHPFPEEVKLENHHQEMYCRPSDVIPPTSEQDIPDSQMMASFPQESLQDFKHVLYNLLVEYHNNPSSSTFLQPCTMEEDGSIRHGFRFNSRQNPEKKLPELYAQHIRKARLDCEDQSSVFIQDLYKYYLRACVELLSKYFDKRDKYTYLYDDIPLFVPGESLEQAEERIKTMKTRARKKRRIMTK